METGIFKSMAAIMKSVEAIKKEKTNTQGASFKYRGIDDVMNSLHVAFAENGVFITTEVLDRKETERQSKSGGLLFYVTETIRFTFHAQDGTSVSSTIYGTAMDSGDKADNKCLSIALKYALLQAFLIPTEDMAEPDSQTHEVVSDKKRDVIPAKEPKPMPTDKYEKLVKYMKEEPDPKKQAEVAIKFMGAFTFNQDQTKFINSLMKKS